MNTDEEQPKIRKSSNVELEISYEESCRSLGLKTSITRFKENKGNRDQKKENSLLSSICTPINAQTLTEYDLEEKNWRDLLTELSEPGPEKITNDITRLYEKKRNALMTILVCHPPLDVVKRIVKLGGIDTVTKAGECGFNAIHYACWGNASLEVIKYLLGIGGKDALLHKSKNGGANPLHTACTRYKSTESNSLCDVIRLLIGVGEHDVVAATDFNGEIPIQGLLLRPEIPVESVITYFEEWYNLENNRGQSKSPSQSKSDYRANDPEEADEHVKTALKNGTFEESFNKLTRELLKTSFDSRSQILKTDFMKEYLTKRFIEPLPLAILMMDLYMQVFVVCVFSFLIDNTSPNPAGVSIIILNTCMFWRFIRELMQLTTTSFGAYFSDITNLFDIMQIALIISILSMDLGDSSRRWVLSFATFYAWFELLFELHNFRYDLAVFVVATIKIMKRLVNFLFTSIIFIATFAHVYYISGTNDKDFCNKKNISDAEYTLGAGFTCTRTESYMYSFSNLFTFEIPEGVPRLIPLVYAFVMLILFLNIVIAVICSAFEDVMNESEMSFWSDRLVIVNELGGVLSGIAHSPSLINWRCLFRCCRCSPVLQDIRHERILEEETCKRIDLNLFLPSSDWDRIKEEDKAFIHWWYGKTKEETCPTWIVRLTFFIKQSRLKDIFIPMNVFENILLGYNRSHRTTRYEKLIVLPFSAILLIMSNTIFVVVFIAGCISFGLLWPHGLKRYLFSVNNEKKRIIPELEKKTQEISEMKADMSVMKIDYSELKDENTSMREEIQDMRKEILSAIKASKR